jgi:putative ABC transport system permease protein
LRSKTSNKEWAKPNLQIYIPFTVFQAVSEHWWSSQIKQVMIKLKRGVDVELVGLAIRRFFEKKYGKSGEFRVDSDSILVAQMKKFLNLFSILLTAIAVITLTVGGIGITNMMLVSVSERLKEIGIKKSVGATNTSIRYQFLFESIFLCLIAGVFGIIIGICTYQLAIFGASKLIQKLEYSWVFDWSAIFFSVISILLVGVISGLIPALKAEKLQVVDALRSE